MITLMFLLNFFHILDVLGWLWFLANHCNALPLNLGHNYGYNHFTVESLVNTGRMLLQLLDYGGCVGFLFPAV